MTAFALLDKDFTTPLTMPDVKFKVKRYSKTAQGGPDLATVSATGSIRGLWELAEFLGRPAMIWDDYMRLAWLGYLDEVAITAGGRKLGVKIGDMFNRIAVAYSLESEDSSAAGTRATTAWQQNNDSVAQYGTKELLSKLSKGTEAQAIQVCADLLDAYQYPQPTWDTAQAGARGAELTCKGLLSTLDWKYYSQSSTTAVETTTQIASIVTACGQFFTGTLINVASGVSTNPFQRGDNTGLFVIQELLKTGPNGRRLLASINESRELVIDEQPARDANNARVYLTSSGVEDLWGNEIAGQDCPVGMWALQKDVMPTSLDLGRLADPSLIFIEQAEYDVENRIYYPRPRGVTSSWDIASQIVDG